MDEETKERGARPCPICGKPALPRFRPFCSARCRLIDLGRWLGESYRIPAESGAEPEDETRHEEP
jgi:uncharacterized protein